MILAISVHQPQTIKKSRFYLRAVRESRANKKRMSFPFQSILVNYSELSRVLST